jgi:hypothetical protein
MAKLHLLVVPTINHVKGTVGEIEEAHHAKNDAKNQHKT